MKVWVQILNFRTFLPDFEDKIKPKFQEATNWTGFYFRSSENTLQLGPFCGLPACQTLRVGLTLRNQKIRIQFDKGVCGAAAAKNETLLVENVHDFPGHVACDAASNSELVVPLVYKVDIKLVALANFF